jgi:hypothetical protein
VGSYYVNKGDVQVLVYFLMVHFLKYMRDIQLFYVCFLYGTDLSLVLDTVSKIFKHENIAFERQS